MAQSKTVTLVAPDGAEVAVDNPVSVNSLVFGSGYKPKGKLTVDQALAQLADSPAVVAVAADQAIVAQTVTTVVKPSK